MALYCSEDLCVWTWLINFQVTVSMHQWKDGVQISVKNVDSDRETIVNGRGEIVYFMKHTNSWLMIHGQGCLKSSNIFWWYLNIG